MKITHLQSSARGILKAHQCINQASARHQPASSRHFLGKVSAGSPAEVEAMSSTFRISSSDPMRRWQRVVELQIVGVGSTDLSID
jgi:hypothetical protein